MDATGRQVDVEALAGRSGGDGPASSVKVNSNHRLSYQSRRHVTICISDMALPFIERATLSIPTEGIGTGLSACTTPACGNSFRATALFFSWHAVLLSEPRDYLYL
jgi:hypothetical protein